jgi:hypothetical protein
MCKPKKIITKLIGDHKSKDRWYSMKELSDNPEAVEEYNGEYKKNIKREYTKQIKRFNEAQK